MYFISRRDEDTILKTVIKKVCNGITDSIKLTKDELNDLKNVLKRS